MLFTRVLRQMRLRAFPLFNDIVPIHFRSERDVIFVLTVAEDAPGTESASKLELSPVSKCMTFMSRAERVSASFRSISGIVFIILQFLS